MGKVRFGEGIANPRAISFAKEVLQWYIKPTKGNLKITSEAEKNAEVQLICERYSGSTIQNAKYIIRQYINGGMNGNGDLVDALLQFGDDFGIAKGRGAGKSENSGIADMEKKHYRMPNKKLKGVKSRNPLMKQDDSFEISL